MFPSLKTIFFGWLGLLPEATWITFDEVVSSRILLLLAVGAVAGLSPFG